MPKKYMTKCSTSLSGKWKSKVQHTPPHSCLNGFYQKVRNKCGWGCIENGGLNGLEKVSFHSNPKKGNAKECLNYYTTTLISHTSKLMLNILQARLQQYVNRELPDVQAGFRKGRGTRDQIANICWIIEKARVPEKHLFLIYWLCHSLWLCGSQSTEENSERDGNTRAPDLPLEKPICRSGSHS